MGSCALELRYAFEFPPISPPELFGSTETFRERTTDHQHFGFSKMTVTTVEISRSELSSVNCHARHGFRGGAARARTRYFRPWQSANLIYDPAVTLREGNFYRDIEFFFFSFFFFSSFFFPSPYYSIFFSILFSRSKRVFKLFQSNVWISLTYNKAKSNLTNKNLQTRHFVIYIFFVSWKLI